MKRSVYLTLWFLLVATALHPSSAAQRSSTIVSAQSRRTQDAELYIGTLEANGKYYDAANWCSFKSPSASSKSDIFFINADEDPYKLWLNVNGRITALRRVSSTLTNVLRLKKGSSYTERYRSGDITAQITYIVIKKYAEGTAHTAMVVVKKGNRSKTVKTVGECG